MRLIDADALIKVLNKNSIFQKVTNVEGKNTIEIINEQPTIEAVPVVHAEWIEIGVTCGIPILKCSNCGNEHLKLHENSCGYCGADMRKGGAT